MRKLAPFAVAVIASAGAEAHGPVFSPGPETIWKGGTEITLGVHAAKAGDEDATEAFIEAEYGLTANWEVGIEMPYLWKDRGADGLGDISLHTKVQLWRRDLPGAQYKAAALVAAALPTGPDSRSADAIAGLATGYESRRWYWFASGVYRANTETGGIEKGDLQLVSLVGGVRPVLTAYGEPDTVLMLELNWERAGRDELSGTELVNTGGWELFFSPVVWWTYRQFAVRGGVQIPVAESLNGDQAGSDYRARLELVYHF